MKINYKIFVLFAFMILSFASGCEKGLGEINAFQLWSGNVSLPPEYQREMVIRGRINFESISIDYSKREGENKMTKTLELVGEDYEKCVKLVKNTSLEAADDQTGGGGFDVTLIDKTGKNEMGTPSNAAEWKDFADQIQAKADK